MGVIDPELLLNRIQQKRPIDRYIIPHSFPVTSFGDIQTASVVTVGINPSSVEFESRNALLKPGKKRFIDAEALGVQPGTEPSREQAIKILEGNHRYFETRPYGWFNWLERWILNPQDLSYFRGEVAHLDLVQWATHPVWSKIQDEEAKRVLVSSDRDFLAALLSQKKPRLVLLNGQTSVDNFESHGLFRIDTRYELKNSDQRLALSIGEVEGQPAIGWNMFLQSQRTNHDRQILRDEIVSRVARG